MFVGIELDDASDLDCVRLAGVIITVGTGSDQPTGGDVQVTGSVGSFLAALAEPSAQPIPIGP